MPRKYLFPASPAPKSVRLGGFLGIDLTNEPSEVDGRRSPDSVNMISNLGGNIEKRKGIKILHNVGTARVYSVFKQQIPIDGTERDVFIVHVGTELKYYNGTSWAAVNRTGTATAIVMSATPTKFIYNGKKLAIIGDTEFIFLDLAYDTALVVTYFKLTDSTYDEAKKYFYVPTTSISRSPDGVGIPYEEKNLLFDRKANHFYADGTSTEYVLDDDLYYGGDVEGISAWSSGTTYAIGDYVSYSGLYYISLVNSNLNNQPNTTSGSNYISLNGTSAYINCGKNFHNWTDNGAGTMIYEFTFDLAAVGRKHTLFSYGSSDNYNYFTIYIDTDNKVKFKSKYNNSAEYAGAHATALSISTKYKVRVEVVSARVNIRITDATGATVGTDVTGVRLMQYATSSRDKYIGKTYASADYFSGKIYDIYISAGQADYTGIYTFNADGFIGDSNGSTTLLDKYTADGGQNLLAVNATITITATNSWSKVESKYDLTVEVMNDKGTFDIVTNYAVSKTNTIKFAAAPPVSYKVGEDNVKVTFRADYKGNYNKHIGSATNYAFYGVNGVFTYLFLCGYTDETYATREYFGKFDEKLYVGEYQFNDFSTKVMGYSHFGKYLALHTRKVEGFPTIYLRSAGVDNDGEAVFPMETGVSGVGALNTETFANLRDNPMWLSEYGVVSLASSNINDVNHTQDRGHFINTHVLNNGSPDQALGFVYDNKYFLYVPVFGGGNWQSGRLYVADSRRKSNNRDSWSGGWQYDWYLWDSFEMSCATVDNDTLYFGTYHGKICTMKTDADTYPYKDQLYNSGTDTTTETAVVAHWSTPVLNMGDITVKKTLKNLWVRLKKFPNMSARIYYSTRGLVLQKYDGYFDFDQLDFERFTFSTDDDDVVAVTNRAERKFMSIMFTIESNDQYPFVLIEIVAKYVHNSQFKGG